MCSHVIVYTNKFSCHFSITPRMIPPKLSGSGWGPEEPIWSWWSSWKYFASCDGGSWTNVEWRSWWRHCWRGSFPPISEICLQKIHVGALIVCCTCRLRHHSLQWAQGLLLPLYHRCLILVFAIRIWYVMLQGIFHLLAFPWKLNFRYLDFILPI